MLSANIACISEIHADLARSGGVQLGRAMQQAQQIAINPNPMKVARIDPNPAAALFTLSSGSLIVGKRRIWVIIILMFFIRV